jgi:hypothetical protein
MGGARKWAERRQSFRSRCNQIRIRRRPDGRKPVLTIEAPLRAQPAGALLAARQRRKPTREIFSMLLFVADAASRAARKNQT